MWVAVVRLVVYLIQVVTSHFPYFQNSIINDYKTFIIGILQEYTMQTVIVIDSYV